MRGEKKALILSLLAQGKTAYAIHKLTGYAQSYAYRLKGECSPNSGGQVAANPLSIMPGELRPKHS